MTEKIIKGWVSLVGNYEPEIYLLKSKTHAADYYEFNKRKLSCLVANTLSSLGYIDIADGEDDFENGIVDKRVADNVSMQIFASEKQEKLATIKKNVILDSMGLLEYQEDWYGYSTWTIEGFEIDTFTLGGHNILEIIKTLENKYIYLIIGMVE